MKISLNWLTDYVDVSGMPVAELAERLTWTGLYCEAIERTDADIVLDLEITSNRPDCLGHIGVAREVAAAFSLELKLPDPGMMPTGDTPVADITDVKVLEPALCPRYVARVIRGVRIGPSPAWMVERLEAVGLRSVNNVVDATNYVLMEFGQPLHAFDRKRLAGGRIVVRRGCSGERMVSIDEVRCALNEEMLVIADEHKPVAIAGVMGGLESEVRDDTTDILLESAQFDPLTVRRTARALSLMSESSYRFERRVDPVGVDAASLRACSLIIQTAGGELAPGVIDVWAKPYTPANVAMRTSRCRAILGVDVGDSNQVEILSRLGLGANLADGTITCAIPPHRSDLSGEADLIEEVARLHGYEKIPVHADVTHPVVAPAASESLRRGVRNVLAAAGFDEAMTYSFIDDKEAELFGFAASLHVDPGVRRTNNLLRPTLLPCLLRACKNNQDVGNDDVSLYELAAVFPPAAAGNLPDEYVALAMVTQDDLAYLKGTLEEIVRSVRAGEIEVSPSPVAGLAEGQAAEVHLQGRAVGVIGMVDDSVLDYYGLEKPCAAAMIDYDALIGSAEKSRTYKPLPRFPAIRRDLSLIVEEAFTWRQLAEVIDSIRQPQLEALAYVGTYRGEQVPAGKKSMTLTLTYRSADGTLRHEQVDEMVERIVESLAEKAGAQLRR